MGLRDLKPWMVAVCVLIAVACPAAWADESLDAGGPAATAEPLDLFDRFPDAYLYPPRSDPMQQAYSPGLFLDHAAAVKWELAGIFAIKTALGFGEWEWGSDSFHFHSEGYFGMDSGSGGMDKLGHAFSTYMTTEFLTARIRQAAADPAHAPFSAALMATGFMTYVEVFDGFADDHGFSWEDMTANATGAAFSVLRNTVPGLEEKVDFRLEWNPTSREALRHPVTDYMGQKYVLAIKPAGFDIFKETPVRFTELHLGYYARGFKNAPASERERNLYVGVGLNLREIYDTVTHNDNSLASRSLRTGFEYLQVPYTYVPVERQF